VELQRQTNRTYAKMQLKAFHLDGKCIFRTLENMANMNVTTFNTHFKHVTYTIMWGSLNYPSNVN